MKKLLFLLLFLPCIIKAQDTCIIKADTLHLSRSVPDSFYKYFTTCKGWWIFKSCHPDSSLVIGTKSEPYDSIINDTTCYSSQPIHTQFGFMQQGASGATLENLANSIGVNLLRVDIFFDVQTSKRVIDDYLKHGFNVQINFNYKSTSSPVLFPTDTAFIRKQSEAFFKYYQPYLKQIPVVVVENEWDNGGYRDFTKTSITDYITELKIITDVGHKYGFKIADAGFTGTGLARWYYTQVSGTAALKWKSQYYVNEKADNFLPLIQMVSIYCNAVKDIPFDYLNTHWYNIDSCYDGYYDALQAYGKACGKTEFINNEFGIRTLKSTTNVYSLWVKSVEEILKAKLHFALAYSGTDAPKRARQLTPEMLSVIKQSK